MPISIDLHENAPFTKSEIRNQTIFFLVKFSHGILGANNYILPIFKLGSSKKYFLDLDLLGLNAVLPWVLWESMEIAAVSPLKSTSLYHPSVLLPHTDAIPFF